MIWLLLAIPAQVLAVRPNFCDDGWVFDGQKSCFKLSDDAGGHSAGQATCESLGGNLAVPNSYVVDVIFRGYHPYTSTWVWTGVTTEDHKVWSSESPDWYEGEPKSVDGKGCAAMGDLVRDGNLGHISFAPGWADVDCGDTLGLLCEKPCEDCTLDLINPKFDCPEGWKHDRDHYGAHGDDCYKLSSDTKTWQAAQSECEKSGSHLAHISNSAANYLYEHMVRSPVYAVWIGYQKVNDKWVNTDEEPMTYQNWFHGVPGNTGESKNCAELRDLGNTNPWIEEYGYLMPAELPFVPGWNDMFCSAKNQYICQKKVGRVKSDAATIGFNCFQFTIIFVIGLLFR